MKEGDAEVLEEPISIDAGIFGSIRRRLLEINTPIPHMQIGILEFQ